MLNISFYFFLTLMVVADGAESASASDCCERGAWTALNVSLTNAVQFAIRRQYAGQRHDVEVRYLAQGKRDLQYKMYEDAAALMLSKNDRASLGETRSRDILSISLIKEEIGFDEKLEHAATLHHTLGGEESEVRAAAKDLDSCVKGFFKHKFTKFAAAPSGLDCECSMLCMQLMKLFPACYTLNKMLVLASFRPCALVSKAHALLKKDYVDGEDIIGFCRDEVTPAVEEITHALFHYETFCTLEGSIQDLLDEAARTRGWTAEQEDCIRSYREELNVLQGQIFAVCKKSGRVKSTDFSWKLRNLLSRVRITVRNTTY